MVNYVREGVVVVDALSRSVDVWSITKALSN